MVVVVRLVFEGKESLSQGSLATVGALLILLDHEHPIVN